MIEPARALLGHDPGGGPGAKPAAPEVHADDLVKLFLGHLAQGGIAGDAGVVDHDVKRNHSAAWLR